MKFITIAGNVGKDAVTRQTQAGDAVTGFSVAVEERNGQDKRRVWFDVSLWGKRGTSLAQYLTKGTRVSVAGELSTREHEGKTYLTVRAAEVTLLGGGERRGDDVTDAAPRERRPQTEPAQGGRAFVLDNGARNKRSLGIGRAQGLQNALGGICCNVADANGHNAQGQQPRRIDAQRRSGSLARPAGSLLAELGRVWRAEPDVGRVAHGVPQRVDRLAALGNSVVPQIPELIGRAILEAECAQ